MNVHIERRVRNAAAFVTSPPPPLPVSRIPGRRDMTQSLLDRMFQEDLAPVFTAATIPEMEAALDKHAPSYERRLVALHEIAQVHSALPVDVSVALEELGRRYGLADDLVGSAVRRAQRASIIGQRLPRRPGVMERFGPQVHTAFGILLVNAMCLDAMSGTVIGALKPSTLGHQFISEGIRDLSRLAFTMLRAIEITLDEEAEVENSGDIPFSTPDEDVDAVLREGELMDAEDDRRLDAAPDHA